MLTGRPPFEGGSIGETFAKTKNLEFSFPEYISENAKSLISSMLSMDPGSRLTPSEILSHEFFSTQDYSEESFYDYLEAPLSCRNSGLPKSKYKSMQFSLLSPINTFGLQPFVHEIKNGRLEITPYGWLKVIIGSKNLEISPDGSEIFYRSVKYTLKNLPIHAEKIYRYAEQCLHTIKSKTPKIIIEDDQAKYLLMSNLPDANFEAEFKLGVKVYYQMGKSTFKVLKAGEEFFVNMNEEGVWNNFIQVTLQGLKMCIQADSAQRS